MSYGYGGYADIVQIEETFVIYKYSCYNFNNNDYKKDMEIKDGEIYIERDAFVEPDIHKKIIKTKSGRKKTIIKRIKREVDFEELFNSGKIKVENASGTWKVTEAGICIMAQTIIFKIFDKYQEEGEIPLKVAIVK